MAHGMNAPLPKKNPESALLSIRLRQMGHRKFQHLLSIHSNLSPLEPEREEQRPWRGRVLSTLTGMTRGLLEMRSRDVT
jgi:hypothetical protein